MRSKLMLAALMLACAGIVPARGQTTPTGSLTGQVIDPDGLVLPGVTVTVASASLQGTRTAVTSEHGDYIIPFLPPGEYRVLFEVAGFAPLEQTVRIPVAETVSLNAQLSMAFWPKRWTWRPRRRRRISPPRRPPPPVIAPRSSTVCR